MSGKQQKGEALPRIIRRLISLFLLPALLFVLLGLFITQPSCAHYPATESVVSPDRLRRHVETLSIEHAPRSYTQLWNLNASGVYIRHEFERARARVSDQEFMVKGRTYHNVIADFGPETGPMIVIGAHYDACGELPGADDNASGVAGLIELAGLLGRTNLQQHVQLVAYTLEEPPFFGTEEMGSAQHAAGLAASEAQVEAMICLEMIGYFSDEQGSQRFPSVLLKWVYPDCGNYIAVIGSVEDRKLLRLVKGVMRGATDLPVHAMCAPKGFPGIDLSDHRNYWRHAYRAVMVTDTAFYRNANYHKASDTSDTLDYERMAKVVMGVYEAVVHLANDND